MRISLRDSRIRPFWVVGVALSGEARAGTCAAAQANRPDAPLHQIHLFKCSVRSNPPSNPLLQSSLVNSIDVPCTEDRNELSDGVGTAERTLG
ncbi:hypothetical protein FHT76_006401 [Rhizobium sp. BK176]|nr:hypothetical protein [Rhizobium sp. BK176]